MYLVERSDAYVSREKYIYILYKLLILQIINTLINSFIINSYNRLNLCITDKTLHVHHQYSHIESERIKKIDLHGKKNCMGLRLYTAGTGGGCHGFANVWHSHLSNSNYIAIK